jgi:membrane protein implicated in regulation of membrane protease activity
MISSLCEVILEIVAEMLGYAFVRTFLCLAGSVCLAVAICWFVPDQTLHLTIAAVVAIAGLILGVIWEVRAARDTRSGETMGDGKL